MPDMKIIIQGGESGQVQQLLPLEPFNRADTQGEEGESNE